MENNYRESTDIEREKQQKRGRDSRKERERERRNITFLSETLKRKFLLYFFVPLFFNFFEIHSLKPPRATTSVTTAVAMTTKSTLFHLIFYKA